MRVVLIDSPGPLPEPHWSQAFVDGLVAVLGSAGASIRRLRGSPMAPAALHRVTAGVTDIALEVELTRALRREPADAVVHVGTGARGSPNLLWIAERMGSLPFAVVRSSEVVCQRGDLVDWQGQACLSFEDAERCARCCRRSSRRGPSADELRTRLDLIIAGLQVCKTVWLDAGDAAGAAWLEKVGVPRRVIGTAPTAELVRAVADSLREVSASDSAS